MTELRNTITWRNEENDWGGRRFESEVPEVRKDERPRPSWVVMKYKDVCRVTEIYDCCGGRCESWRSRKG